MRQPQRTTLYVNSIKELFLKTPTIFANLGVLKDKSNEVKNEQHEINSL